MSDDEETFSHGDTQYKIVLVGDGSAGKTSISKRFAQDKFGKDYQQTIGVDFFSKRIDMPDGTTSTMSVWDIGGQSLGSQMLDKYFHGASAVLFVYDITNGDSFENLQDWFRIVTKNFESKPKQPYSGLIGNKCDLAHMRAINPTTHEDFAKKCKMASYFVSAKSGDQVTVCFKRVLSAISGQALSKAELEGAAPIVRAVIPKPEVGMKPVPIQRATPKKTSSGVCVLQ